MPIRLQLSRRKGFDLQAMSRATNGLDAVNVARPSKWGNPFIVGQPCGVFAKGLGFRGRAEVLIPGLTLEQCIEFYRDVVIGTLRPEMYPQGHAWRDAFLKQTRNWWPGDAARSLLRGKNLACWCALPAAGKPDMCHAAVLIEVANK